MSSGPARIRASFVRAAVVSALALAAVAVTADPAAAGGSWLAPVRDRYEPGEAVTLVAYVGPGGTLGSVEDGPFFGYLRRLEVTLQAPTDLPVAPFDPQPSDLRLGQLVVERTGRTDYTAYRASIQFLLPRDLPVGRYGVSYCNATCTKGLSDLIGGVVFVGRDPDGPIPRTWPLHEPEIANLSDDAMLYGPRWQITARDARARPPEPPATSTPATTATAANTDRAARGASESTSRGRGSAGWALPVLLVTAALATMVIALFIRRVPKR
jgi:hypothetical protein